MSTLMDSWPRRHRITVEEYHRMAEVGLLAPDARVELIEGEIIDMAPVGTGHCSVVDSLGYRLFRAVGDRAIVRNQGAILLDDLSMPQPDFALLTARADFYRHAHPTPADILLIAEVSDSTLRYDHDVKMPLYARHGIPEAWILDLQHGALHVLRKPQDGAYRDVSVTSTPGVTTLAALPGIGVDLTGVFSS